MLYQRLKRYKYLEMVKVESINLLLKMMEKESQGQMEDYQ